MSKRSLPKDFSVVYSLRGVFSSKGVFEHRRPLILAYALPLVSYEKWSISDRCLLKRYWFDFYVFLLSKLSRWEKICKRKSCGFCYFFSWKEWTKMILCWRKMHVLFILLLRVGIQEGERGVEKFKYLIKCEKKRIFFITFGSLRESIELLSFDRWFLIHNE